MYQLGLKAGIKLDYNVQTNWQPVKSQRLMLWASRYGKQELYMDVLAKKHFENRTSASHTDTLLRVAEEVGLDVAAARQFLATDELEDVVWASYRSTIHEKGIHAIPFFVFNTNNTDGGPFRSGKGDATIVRGSGDIATFREMFESMLRKERGSSKSRY